MPAKAVTIKRPCAVKAMLRGPGGLKRTEKEFRSNILQHEHQKKKSKASSDHPRKFAATTCFCSLVQPDNAAIAIKSASKDVGANISYPRIARYSWCRKS